MKSFEIEYTFTALDEIEENFRWINERAPQAAQKWRDELIERIDSLADNPLCCPLAPENSKFSREIRLLLFRSKRSQLRIYYTVDGKRVVVLTVRRVFRKPLEKGDL